MKKFLVLAFAAVTASVSTSCTSAYWHNRTQDCADSFTCAVGTGAGAQARVSVLSLGLLYNKEVAGLREGNASVYGPEAKGKDVDLFIFRGDTFTPNIDPLLKARRKASDGSSGIGPFVYPRSEKVNVSYLTNIEAIVGIGPSVRLGFNPLEFLDLLIGFTTFDLLGDDIAVAIEHEVEETVD